MEQKAKNELYTTGPLLKPDEEAILLGAWLSEIHTEHIHDFEKSDFTHEKIFNALSQGLNAIEIVDKDIGYSRVDIAVFISAYSEIFYEQYYRKARELRTVRLVARGIAQGRPLDALQKIITDVSSINGLELPATRMVDRIKDRMEFRKNEKCITYGLPKLDRLTGGLHRGELTVVAARPGVGKSSFAMQLATRSLKWGERTMYFSLEMLAEEQYTRMLIQAGKATQAQIRANELPQEAETLLQKIEESGNLKMYERTRMVDGICDLIHKEKPYLVIIDQLTQLRAKGKRASRLEELQDITRTLKQVSLDEQVAVLLLCQINRDGANTEPTLANLKGSGQIEEDADNVILLHDKSKGQAEYTNNLFARDRETLLMLEKQRNGPTARYTISFLPDRYLFREQEEQ